MTPLTAKNRSLVRLCADVEKEANSRIIEQDVEGILFPARNDID
jgi:hypothetical protein